MSLLLAAIRVIVAKACGRAFAMDTKRRIFVLDTKSRVFCLDTKRRDFIIR